VPKKLNISFVGCGGIAAKYWNVYRDLDFVRVVSCVSGSIESARRGAAELPGAIATTDFGAALAPDVDAVILNTPNALHRDQAIAAIEAGKHVLLQKPVAANVPDAEAVALAAEKSSRTVGLYMSYFDQPLVHDFRDMADRGWFGDIVHFYARLMHRGGIEWSEDAIAGKPNWRGSLEATGGGCFLMLGVHFIHTFQWISRSKITSVRGFARNLHSPGVGGEDLACAVMQLESGAMITLDMAWCAENELVSINGTRGRLDYHNNRTLTLASTGGPFSGRVISCSGEPQQLEIVAPELGDASNPLNQHRAFLEAARDGKPAPISIRSGVDDMRIVAALYQQLK
jgi:predicted dehydrogenase